MRSVDGGATDTTTAVGPARTNRMVGPRGLYLRVLGDRIYARRALPASGEVLIGRSTRADIRIDDPSVSRQHALLRVGPRLQIVDLDSSNGTFVVGRRLRAREAAPIEPGELVEVGSVILLVQEAPGGEWSKRKASRHRRDRRSSTEGLMERLDRLVERVARSGISVLIVGETGVGKEVLAETIHRRSQRADRPFLRLSCAALPEPLLESELFGHERGAFTGALKAKPGLLETAHGGTVFLDEVGELPLSIQVKLLRVLEERQVLRVGGLRPPPLDVRFIAATHRDLRAEIAAGRFRHDLYFRLDGISLYVPPLRERVSEIAGLADQFIGQASIDSGRGSAPTLSREAIALLNSYDWPGNIRELRNVIERAVLLSTDDRITPEHLPALSSPATPASAAAVKTPAMTGGTLEETVKAAERARIEQALVESGGNQTRAARLLGISRGSLLTRLDAYRISRPRKRR